VTVRGDHQGPAFARLEALRHEGVEHCGDPRFGLDLHPLSHPAGHGGSLGDAGLKVAALHGVEAQPLPHLRPELLLPGAGLAGHARAECHLPAVALESLDQVWLGREVSGYVGGAAGGWGHGDLLWGALQPVIRRECGKRRGVGRFFHGFLVLTFNPYTLLR